MKKPDILVFLTLIVALGAAITGMTSDEQQARAHVVASENSIR